MREPLTTVSQSDMKLVLPEAYEANMLQHLDNEEHYVPKFQHSKSEW